MTYDYPHLNQNLLDALDRYHYQHIPTGGFLRAVITNDLMRALGNADGVNKDVDVLQELVWYVHNELPSAALDFVAWTTCFCALSSKECLVHTYPEAELRELSNA